MDMAILVVTASFTSGLTDILFNKVMVYMTGHIRVVEDSYTTRRSDVIRDMPRLLKIIKDAVPGIVRVDQVVTVRQQSPAPRLRVVAQVSWRYCSPVVHGAM